jgi:hypothetical protein
MTYVHGPKSFLSNGIHGDHGSFTRLLCYSNASAVWTVLSNGLLLSLDCHTFRMMSG